MTRTFKHLTPAEVTAQVRQWCKTCEQRILDLHLSRALNNGQGDLKAIDDQIAAIEKGIAQAVAEFPEVKE